MLGLLVLNAAPDLLGTSGGSDTRGSSAQLGPAPEQTPVPTATEGRSWPSDGGAGPGETPSTTFTAPTPSSSVTVGGRVFPGPSGEDPADVAESEALRNLQAQSRRDLGRLQLRGQWVPMLASKWVGVVDPLQTTATGGHRFAARDIWAEHTRLRAAGGAGAATEVILLQSTDIGQQLRVEGRPLWMTFAVGDFSSRAQAQAWCAERFPGKSGAGLANVCTPWRLDPPRR